MYTNQLNNICNGVHFFVCSFTKDMLLYKYFSRFLLRFLLYLSIKKFSNVNKLLFLRKPFSSKILFRFWIEDEFFFFKWSYSQRCFDVAQRVVSTWLNVVNFNVDVHNVVSTLIWHCVTSRRHINLKATLNRRWNVCWVTSFQSRKYKLLQNITPGCSNCYASLENKYVNNYF